MCFACGTKTFTNDKPITQRIVYVLPEALPAPYAWRVHDRPVSTAVWVGYRWDKKGALTAAEGKRITAEVKKNPQLEHHLLLGIKNTPAGVKLLTQGDIRHRAIQALNNVLRTMPGIRGIQLDFEYLSPAHADAYVSFLITLKQSISPKLRISAAVFPPVGMPTAWSAFHKLPEIAAAADGIVVMLYDYHRQGTKPGCVSGLHWLDENTAILAKLPRDKVWLGAPLYGYKFAQKRATAISYKGFQRIPAAENTADGCRMKTTSKNTAYYPAPELYEHYDALTHKYGFAGVAYWRAGLE